MRGEEAIEYFKMKVFAREAIGNDIGADYEAYKIALSVLRPVSRDQVEQVWRSYWDGFSNRYADGYEVYDEWQCRKCGFEVETDEPETLAQFCPACGAPMTDEAVQMVMERLEALHETT